MTRLTRREWHERYYRPLPANIKLVHVDHRAEHLAEVLEQANNLHAFGQMLYHDVIARQDGGRPFNGTALWFKWATERGWVPKPNKPFPPTDVTRALVLYNCHTIGMFERWAKTAKVITLTSYIGFLRRHDIPISLKPITDPLTREAMTRRA